MRKALFTIITISTLSAVILFSPTGMSQTSKYEGMVVTRIEFRGLRRNSPGTFLKIMKTREGAPLNIKELGKDRNNLMQFGQLSELTISYSEYRNGVSLRLTCSEKGNRSDRFTRFEGTEIERINFVGLNLISANDLAGIMKTAKGKKFSLSLLEKDIEEIRKIGKVDKVFYWLEASKEKVVLSISIVEKEFTFLKPEKYEGKMVRKMRVFGLVNINSTDILDEMKTTPGYPLRAMEIKEDIKKIFHEFKFSNVEIMIEEYKGGVRLGIFCKESPQVKTIIFKGMDKFQEADIIESLPLKEGEVYRKDFLEKSISLIKKKYDEEGLFNAIVTYRILPVEDENNVEVEIIIDEGEDIKVAKISLLGARKIDPEELFKVFETKEETAFDDGTFKRDIYEQDKGKLLAYYKENGYLDAQIIEDKVEYEWEDPTRQEKRAIFIVIKLTEGDKYYFDGYTIDIKTKGKKPVVDPDVLMKNFQLNEKGELFNNTKFLMDKQNISFLYASRGYIFARVTPNRTVTEREVVVDNVKEKRKFVKIDFVIYEGNKAYVEGIIIKGNKKTKDKVIRREILIKEGELFDSRKVQISREKVFNLGFFKQVNFDMRPGSTENYMNLIVDVEEQPSGTISLGGGYGTTSGFSIFADLAENNLMGNGQRVGIKFEYGPQRRSVTLSFMERWLFDYPVGFDASVFYHLYNLTDTSIFENSNEESEYQKQVVGYSMGLSYRFLYFYEIGTRWTHSFKSYINPTGNSKDDIFLAVAEGLQEKRTQSVYLYRNTKDNYLNPTSGSKIGVSVGFTGSLLGGQDHFLKYSPEVNFYFSPFHIPFLKTHPCVIEIRANGTFLMEPFRSSSIKQSYEENAWLESEDRLRMGGPETIRGWDYLDNSFPDSWSDVGLYHRILYGFEFRIPIHPQMLWLAFFWDAGSLWTDKFWEKQLIEDNYDIVSDDKDDGLTYDIRDMFSDKVNLMEYFRYSWGLGFRVQIPMMPLRFWFGRKMLYRDGGFKEISGFTFQFAIGDMRF